MFFSFLSVECCCFFFIYLLPLTLEYKEEPGFKETKQHSPHGKARDSLSDFRPCVLLSNLCCFLKTYLPKTPPLCPIIIAWGHYPKTLVTCKQQKCMYYPQVWKSEVREQVWLSFREHSLPGCRQLSFYCGPMWWNEHHWVNGSLLYGSCSA